MARGDAIAKGLEAERAVTDPILIQAYESVERDLVNALAAITLTGTAACTALVMEKVREIQTNRRARAKLWEMVSSGKLEAKRQDTAELRPQRTKDPRWG